jgi:hypothetical protein
MMTELLEQALEAVRTMPPATQDDIARVVLRLAKDDDGTSPVTLSPEERATIAISKAAAARGEFATDADVQAVWAKHGL